MLGIFKTIKNLFRGDDDVGWLQESNHRMLHITVEQNKQIMERLNKIMSALANLQEAINRLANATDVAVTELNTPHPSEEAIQAAADLVNAQATRLETAAGVVTPTAPADTAVAANI